MIYDIQPIVDNLKQFLKDQTIKGSLDIVKTSDDFASKKYIGNKIKLGQELGFKVRVIRPEEMATSQADGIIVQLPVGEGYDEQTLVESVPKEKDVDGFHLETLGKIMRDGNAQLAPCTARGIVQIIYAFYNGALEGKNVVIVNRSNIVGKPLAMMLLGLDCTVTVCHSKTPEKVLLQHLKEADVVVTAVGKKNFIKRPMLKDGALVVDVAINRDENGKVCGDVAECVKNSPYVWTTPVPRGVGQLTVLNLLYNTHCASRKGEC